jgi:signal transduction histidine kinase
VCVDASAPGAAAAVLERFVEAVSRADADVDADADADAFYGRLAEAVCDLGPMRRAVILRYDEALERIHPVGAHGLDPGAGETAAAWPSMPLVRRVLEEGRVLEMCEGAVCTPMAAAGRNVGVIFSDREADSDPLCEHQRERLSIVGKAAALAAVAWIATSHHEHLRQAAERVELTREMHEQVVQRLFGVSLALSGADALGRSSQARCADEIQAALLDLRTVLRRPLPGSPADTDTTLREMAHRLARVHPRLRLEIEWPDDVAVPAELEPTLQALLGELIRNVHKHASPSRTLLRIAVGDGMLELALTNDGAPVRSARLGGAGLQLAAFDALRVGGTLAVGPHEDGTWRARVLIPIGEPG